MLGSIPTVTIPNPLLPPPVPAPAFLPPGFDAANSAANRSTLIIAALMVVAGLVFLYATQRRTAGGAESFREDHNPGQPRRIAELLRRH